MYLDKTNMLLDTFAPLKRRNKEEIANIISSLNSNKASNPNTIPYRILFLLKNEISKQLVDLFNLSFMTGVFPSVPKCNSFKQGDINILDKFAWNV